MTHPYGAAWPLYTRTCFAKYHRGRFFGFRVELKGHWLCPYAVWLEPDDASSNAIVRHASSNDVPSRANNHGLRKNSYLQGQFVRCHSSVHVPHCLAVSTACPKRVNPCFT